jgi:uncharacterized cupredoxin-like copper-binding protein
MAVVLAAAVIVVGCAPIEPGLNLELTDHSITADRPSVPAGQLVFAIHNAGTVVHELVVVRTDLAADALAFDPVSLQATVKGVVAEREAIVAGVTKRLSVDLEPGHYVLICNLPGHYAAGMRVALEAR